jgi:hypothetical protein
MNDSLVSEEKWNKLGETARELDPFLNTCDFGSGLCYVLHVDGDDNLKNYIGCLEQKVKELGIKDSISIKSSNNVTKKRGYLIKVSRK